MFEEPAPLTGQGKQPRTELNIVLVPGGRLCRLFRTVYPPHRKLFCSLVVRGYYASQLYAKNLSRFLPALVKDGQIELDMEDEIVRDTLVARDGKVVRAEVAARVEGN
jgi:hypothetical protein